MIKRFRFDNPDEIGERFNLLVKCVLDFMAQLALCLCKPGNT